MWSSRNNAPVPNAATPRANAAYMRAMRAQHEANEASLRKLAHSANAAANLEKRYSKPLSPIAPSKYHVVRIPRGEIKKKKSVFGNLYKSATNVGKNLYRTFLGEHPNIRNARLRKRRAISQSASHGKRTGTNVRQAAAALMKMSKN